jgi:hypothetical protein
MLRHNSQLAKTAAASACLFQSQAKKRLSVRELRQSLLEVIGEKMRAEQDRVILVYRHRSGDGEWNDEQYPVRIARTPCNLGGSRAWFICPAVGCRRRVAIPTAAASSPVGAATSSPMPARARMQVDVRQGGRTGFGRGWGGSPAY